MAKIKTVGQEFSLVFTNKDGSVHDAWWFVGSIEEAITQGRRSRACYGCAGFRVEKYGNPDIVYFSQEAK